MTSIKVCWPNSYIFMNIIEAHIVTRFKIHLLFENGVSGIVDLSDLAGRGVFKTWMKPGVFEQMTVEPLGFLLWPGEIDLCADSLYLRLTGKKPEDIFPLIRKKLVYA